MIIQFIVALLGAGLVMSLLHIDKARTEHLDEVYSIRTENNEIVEDLLGKLARTDEACVYSKHLIGGKCKLKDLIKEEEADIYCGGVRIFGNDGYSIEFDAEVRVGKEVEPELKSKYILS